jgi:hypothetical protein
MQLDEGLVKGKTHICVFLNSKTNVVAPDKPVVTVQMYSTVG